MGEENEQRNLFPIAPVVQRTLKIISEVNDLRVIDEHELPKPTHKFTSTLARQLF